MAVNSNKPAIFSKRLENILVGDDEIVVESDTFRSQDINRKDALERLNNIIKERKEAEDKNIEYVPKHKNYDVEEIKKIPIDAIVKITPQKFFVNNPFRKERSPSNSLYWYKGTNTWMDFATDIRGDNIDLIMCINDCNFKEALEYLSQYI